MNESQSKLIMKESRLRKPIKQLSTKPAGSSVTNRQHGPNDPVLDYMRRSGIPITRKSYLNLAYMGNPPEDLSVEGEANLPAEIRQSEFGDE